jgi:hypothetical protein
MWMYLGPSCPDYPFPIGLGDVEINTRIQGVLAHGVDLNFGSGPIPLREGVDNPLVSPLEFTFVYLYQFLLLNACAFLRRVSGMHIAPRGGRGITLPKDTVRREANRTHNERLWVWRQGRRAWSAARAVATARGRTLPLSLNAWEVMMKTRKRRRGR